MRVTVLPGPAGEELEQLVLLRGQFDPLSATGDLSAPRIKFQVGDPQGRGLLGQRRTANQGVEARQKFAEGEGFDEVVIGPGLQSRDPIIDGAERGQHQHRRQHAFRPQQADRLQSAHARQHAIHDHHVMASRHADLDALVARARQINRMANLGQPASDEGGGALIVFDDQNFHDAQHLRMAGQHHARPARASIPRSCAGELMRTSDKA